ncbi:MAG: M55 family metallopeptidase [Bryobacteraceae bacterium]|nr:M55 family metallopeptidase [Bryobacteraceae bacterium]
MTRRIILITAIASVAAAQGPRIFIISDMEGVGGVYSWEEQVAPGQRRFEESKRLLTGEINAAVEGALEAGASEVVVWDGHNGHRSLSIEDIHPRAKLIQGPHTGPDFYMKDRRFDGLMFIGQQPRRLHIGHQPFPYRGERTHPAAGAPRGRTDQGVRPLGHQGSGDDAL